MEWDDADVIGCFSWLRPRTQWLQFTNNKIYQQYKTKTSNNTDVKCRIVRESGGERNTCFEWMWRTSAEQVQGWARRSPQSSILRPALMRA